jgi:hypothetical protein
VNVTTLTKAMKIFIFKKKKDLEIVVSKFKICVKVQAFGNNDGNTTLNYYCCYHVDAL